MVILGTRKEYHAKKGKKIFGLDDCPICKPGNIIWKGKNWFLMVNEYPYSGNDRHLMAVPYAHKNYSHELSSEEFMELHDVHNFVKGYYGDENYFSATRETMGNRSIEHYHMHFLPGRLQGKYLRKMLENQGFPITEEEL